MDGGLLEEEDKWNLERKIFLFRKVLFWPIKKKKRKNPRFGLLVFLFG